MIPSSQPAKLGQWRVPASWPQCTTQEEPIQAFLGIEMWALGDRRPLLLIAGCCSLGVLTVTVPSRAEWQSEREGQTDRQRWGERPDDLV